MHALCNFCNKLFFYGVELLAPHQTPSQSITPYHPPTTANSIYSQLPSMNVNV
jgi:hypothetical protein